ncbi:MAG: hypothetical protein JO336_20300 [Acidobacteriia bacterium]|nr:hypothetical protein [Terriglobia bacterium]MBV8905998.1 hypothetical protein [Terriglobia bacterium]
MKGLHLALGLTQFCAGEKALTDGLAFHLAGQAEVRPVAGLIGLVAMTVGLSAATLDGGNRATTKITQRQDLGQNAGPLLFQSGESIGHGALQS